MKRIGLIASAATFAVLLGAVGFVWLLPGGGEHVGPAYCDDLSEVSQRSEQELTEEVLPEAVESGPLPDPGTPRHGPPGDFVDGREISTMAAEHPFLRGERLRGEERLQEYFRLAAPGEYVSTYGDDGLVLRLTEITDDLLADACSLVALPGSLRVEIAPYALAELEAIEDRVYNALAASVDELDLSFWMSTLGSTEWDSQRGMPVLADHVRVQVFLEEGAEEDEALAAVSAVIAEAAGVEESTLSDPHDGPVEVMLGES